MKSIASVNIYLCICLWVCCSPNHSGFQKQYFNQPAPGTEAMLFAPAMLDTAREAHSYPAFSSAGNLALWSSYTGRFTNQHIRYSRFESGTWSAPEIVPFTSVFMDNNPVFSLDGGTVYFHSRRPDAAGSAQPRIWKVTVHNGTWSEPDMVPLAPDSDFIHSQLSFTKNGWVYFAADRNEGPGGADIYRSRMSGNLFSAPELLGPEINTVHQEVGVFVDPEERFLLFTSLGRPDGPGNGDIYASFRQEDGGWSVARPLPEPVNSPNMELFAGVSPDGAFLFFTSDRGGSSAVYWIGTGIIFRDARQ